MAADTSAQDQMLRAAKQAYVDGEFDESELEQSLAAVLRGTDLEVLVEEHGLPRPRPQLEGQLVL